LRGSDSHRRVGRAQTPRVKSRARISEPELIAAARQARQHAIAGYSGFAVGAALATADGDVITGCNVENATYGLTMCAERVALFKALSMGHRAFLQLAVVADSGSPAPPCGACRQLLQEFAPNIAVVGANLGRRTRRWRPGSLLPDPFTRRTLDEHSSRKRRSR
jgi:cytidine deaminase